MCWWNAEVYKQYLYSLGKSNFCSNSVGKQQLSMDNVMGKSINSNCKVTNEREPRRKSKPTIEWGESRAIICSTGFFLVQFRTRLYIVNDCILRKKYKGDLHFLLSAKLRFWQPHCGEYNLSTVRVVAHFKMADSKISLTLRMFSWKSKGDPKKMERQKLKTVL